MRLMHAHTPDAIFGIVVDSLEHCDSINLTAALQRLAKYLAARPRERASVLGSPCFAALVGMMVAQCHAGAFNPQSTSNAWWAVSKLFAPDCPAPPELLDALEAALLGCLAAPREGEGFPDAGALAAAVADRALDSLADAQRRSDLLMAELGKECENGRLLRLLARLGTIVGRPGLGADAEWAETGDRYLLKLFYSFLLHQTDERGSPVLDWGVLAEALNKFDAGVPEQVMGGTIERLHLGTLTLKR